MSILVTGGAGYIGSHTCVELLERGEEIVVADNLSNSKQEALKRVEQITGKQIKFYEVDLLDKKGMEEIFKNEAIDSVIHFAGLKAVGESVKIPLKYYENNITGTLVLLELMQQYNVKNLIFSSSATVYGDVKTVPIPETAATSTTSPYGSTKLMLEGLFKELYVSDNSWNIIILRYFNPIGAHKSGMLGEDPNGIPNNLLPYISQVAIGRLKELSVYGDDYPTKDGSGVRDYIHVVDLADGHVKALDRLKKSLGYEVFNLGTGAGVSVFEMISAFEKASGREIPFKVTARRGGDIAECYADCTKARNELGWSAKYNLDDMCCDSWNWQFKNPNGFE